MYETLYKPSQLQRREVLTDLKHWIEHRQTSLFRLFHRDRNGYVIALTFPPLQDEEFQSDLSRHFVEKLAIARDTEPQLNQQDVIFLDSGTTLFYLALNIAVERRFGSELTVITNNLSVLPVLTGKATIRLVPGKVDRFMIISPFEYTFADESINKSIISVTGLSYEHGIRCETALVEHKKQAVSAATKGTVMFLADHSKIGATDGDTFITFDELNELKKRSTNSQFKISIITDANINRCRLDKCIHASRSGLFKKELQRIDEVGIYVKQVSTNPYSLRFMTTRNERR